MAEAIAWWLVLEVLALFSLVPAFLLFRSLPDRGYGLAKALGLLLPAYALWILAWSGFLPNGRVTILFIVLCAAGASGALLYIKRQLRESLQAFLRCNAKLIIVTEAVFTVAFFALVAFRAYHPDIAGTEQPMDFAFLNSTLRSTYFPPNDPWYSGQSISYYYFGYLMQSLPIQITGIASGIGYNLALATIFALTVTGAFSLAYNLVATRSTRAAVWAGVLAAILIAVIGNLQGALELVRARGLGSPALWQWIGVNGALTPYTSPSWVPNENFWWWRATRVINTLRISTGPGGAIGAVDDHLDYTITEFPFFTFLLGDMHPHLMALPFTLLALGQALSFLRRDHVLDLKWLRREPLAFIGAALVLGAIGFLNSWDLPAYLVIAICAIILGAVRQGRFGWRVLGLIAALGLASILLYIPFYLGPKPQVQGLGLVGAVGTSPIHLFIVLGPLLFAMCYFLLERLRGAGREALSRPHLALISIGVAVVPVLLWALGQAAVQRIGGLPGLSPGQMIGKELSTIPLVLTVASLLFMVIVSVKHPGRPQPDPLPEGEGVTGCLTAGEGTISGLSGGNGTVSTPLEGEGTVVASLEGEGANLCTERLVQEGERIPSPGGERVRVRDPLSPEMPIFPSSANSDRSEVFVLLMALVGFALLLGTELFFLRDAFGNRMNTIFKFYYQVWVLFAMVSAYGIYWITAKAAVANTGRWLRNAWLVGLALLLISAACYPVAASYSRTDMFGRKPSLDGLAFVKGYDPSEYAAIQWLNKNVPGSPVIVEAPGDSYTDFGRISSRTGLPTIIEWPGHEIQWRGASKDLGDRQQDVNQIYGSADNAMVQRLLDKYGAQYVYVGRMERQRYGEAVGTKFAPLLDLAFQDQGVTIYRVRR